ncbi:MAG: DUF6489 family protein [Woeseiaceae bacterium]|nr:DUF6489 family protein [Woeseiaceae bacterium]
MKIRVEFELTPQEFRESLGLPNISGLQDEALSMLKDRIGSDIDAIDLNKVVGSWFSHGIEASKKVQELVTAAASAVLAREMEDSEQDGDDNNE